MTKSEPAQRRIGVAVIIHRSLYTDHSPRGSSSDAGPVTCNNIFNGMRRVAEEDGVNRFDENDHGGAWNQCLSICLWVKAQREAQDQSLNKTLGGWEDEESRCDDGMPWTANEDGDYLVVGETAISPLPWLPLLRPRAPEGKGKGIQRSSSQSEQQQGGVPELVRARRNSMPELVRARSNSMHEHFSPLLSSLDWLVNEAPGILNISSYQGIHGEERARRLNIYTHKESENSSFEGSVFHDAGLRAELMPGFLDKAMLKLGCLAQDSLMPQGSPVTQDPPMAQGSPVTQDPPMAQGSPVTPDPPMVQGSPVTHDSPMAQGSPVTHDSPMAQGSPVTQDPPMAQGSPVTQDTPMAQGSPVTQDTPMAQDPPAAPGAPDVGPCSQVEVPRDLVPTVFAACFMLLNLIKFLVCLIVGLLTIAKFPYAGCIENWHVFLSLSQKYILESTVPTGWASGLIELFIIHFC